MMHEHTHNPRHHGLNIQLQKNLLILHEKLILQSLFFTPDGQSVVSQAFLELEFDDDDEVNHCSHRSASDLF